MSSGDAWVWGGLFLLGAYHGLNPAMGWLFAVALGMQERSASAVRWAIAPIAIGHALAVAAVLALAMAVNVLVPLEQLKLGVAAVLFAFGIYGLVSGRHPRWGGMRVKPRDLAIWSFLMASAHGAGFMVLPLVLEMSPGSGATASVAAHAHHLHAASLAGPVEGLGAVGVHTLGYLIVTALVAWVVYVKLGVAMLRRAWVNLDFVWALALIGAGVFTLVA